MLKNIPAVLPPALICVLDEMGHGDEIVIGDGNFPAESMNARTIRMDGHSGTAVLEAILTLLPLDAYADENFLLMQKVPGDACETPIWDEYAAIAARLEGDRVRPGSLERFAFYERTKRAYAVVATGEKALYANVLLKKGTIA